MVRHFGGALSRMEGYPLRRSQAIDVMKMANILALRPTHSKSIYLACVVASLYKALGMPHVPAKHPPRRSALPSVCGSQACRLGHLCDRNLSTVVYFLVISIVAVSPCP